MCSTIVEQIFVIRSFLTHNQKILQTATFNSIYIVYVHKINVTFKSYSTTITTQNIIGYNPKQAVSNWHKVPLRNVFMQYVVCVVPQISIYTFNRSESMASLPSSRCCSGKMYCNMCSEDEEYIYVAGGRWVQATSHENCLKHHHHHSTNKTTHLWSHTQHIRQSAPNALKSWHTSCVRLLYTFAIDRCI